MKTTGAQKLLACALALPLCDVTPLAGAEIRGAVAQTSHGRIFAPSTDGSVPVSLALLPLDGQRVPKRGPQTSVVAIEDNRMQPVFLTVQRGDRIEFVNRAPVLHEIFSVTSGNRTAARLGKRGDGSGDRARFVLPHAGRVDFLCRIHPREHVRVDVVDTPHIRILHTAGEFDFPALPPGRWRLRVASPLAETQWHRVAAVISPPPLSLNADFASQRRIGAGIPVEFDVEGLYQTHPDRSARP